MLVESLQMRYDKWNDQLCINFKLFKSTFFLILLLSYVDIKNSLIPRLKVNNALVTP